MQVNINLTKHDLFIPSSVTFRESKISAYETIGMHASLEKIYIKLHFEGKNELLYVLNGDNYFSENVPCQRRALDHMFVGCHYLRYLIV